MKIIAVAGSPRGSNGYTSSLLSPLLKAAEAAGAETEIFSLDKLTVLPCRGCLEVCHIKGKCHQQDDFEMILKAMLKADGIVFAVPNYMFGVTAQLKAVLDRCSLPLHSMRFYGKYAATVVTCGGSDPDDVEHYLNKILTQFGLRMVGGVNGVEMQFLDPDENTRIMESSAELGQELVAAIDQHKVIPKQEEQIQQAFEIMAYLVQTKQAEWKVAFEYWNKNWKEAH